MDKQKIGGFIAATRKERGMTQKELGQRLHVSDRAVSKWERGLNLPDASLFEPLCRELGISITELLRGEGEEATVSELEQVVSDTVSLAGHKERLARRSKALAQGLLALLVFLGIWLYAVSGGPLRLLWGASDRVSNLIDQASNPAIPILPAVQLYYPERDALANYSADSYIELQAGGSRGAYFSTSDGALRKEDRPLRAAYPLDSEENKRLYVLDIAKQETMYFRLMGNGSERGEYEVEVYRYPKDLLGEDMTLEEGRWVLHWETISKTVERSFEDSMYFYIYPDYYYTIVIGWGDGNFVEYPFRTT